MAAPARTDAKYHVLLVGVDDYKTAPLGGCVNDIDAVQRVLLGDRMGLAKDRIRRLASPRPGAHHDTAVAEQPATLDNLRAALAELGSDKVSPGDRVFIYYSGHGTRAEVVAPDGRRSHREALVPVDYASRPPDLQLLFDFEINALLRAIVARTRAVTAVLDCCYAAGATRDGEALPGWLPRFLDLAVRNDGMRAPCTPLPHPAPEHPGGGGGLHGPVGAIDDCHVVSACLNHEIAREDAGNGMRNGLLTRALLTALDATREADLRAVTWARIWQVMQAYVAHRNPSQHPWMSGNAGRAVFAGPPVEGDPGLPVHRAGNGCRIAAGTLASITPGAVVAIYGEQPAHFPPLDSAEDRRARLGLVRVTAADDATATATALGAPFDPPPGARGRLVKAGAAGRLRCAVVPASDALEAQLAASPLLELVDSSRAAVTLAQHDDRWFVTDALHGKRPPEPILCALGPDQLDRAHAVLEHYHAYSQPLRMAELIHDLQGGLELSVLSCPAGGLSPAEAQAAALPEATSRGKGTYALASGATVCFHVHNRTPHGLRVTLMNSAASGKVQLLGDQVIAPGMSHVFWADNSLGAPFEMAPPPGVSHCIDRMVAIGRTAMDHDLGYLGVGWTFAQVIQRSRSGARDIGSHATGAAAPLERWAAAQAVLETRRP